jgi:hypothetical protein
LLRTLEQIEEKTEEIRSSDNIQAPAAIPSPIQEGYPEPAPLSDEISFSGQAPRQPASTVERVPIPNAGEPDIFGFSGLMIYGCNRRSPSMLFSATSSCPGEAAPADAASMNSHHEKKASKSFAESKVNARIYFREGEGQRRERARV